MCEKRISSLWGWIILVVSVVLAASVTASGKVIYMDGVEDSASPAAYSGEISTNNYNVLIGENAEHRGRYFNGLIDDVRIYVRALSAGWVTFAITAAGCITNPAGKLIIFRPKRDVCLSYRWRSTVVYCTKCSLMVEDTLLKLRFNRGAGTLCVASMKSTKMIY
ncbi:MAG: LamG-like jellyroll fold domain-containing protein [Planctomycetota bacterium]|jgi:hypothetical protein